MESAPNSYISEYVFVVCEYGALLEDLDKSLLPVFIITRLISEGYTEKEARELLHKVQNNPRHFRKIVKVLSNLIRKQNGANENLNGETISRTSEVTYNPHKEMQDRIDHVAVWCVKEAGKELGKEILKKAFGALIGVRL